MRRALRLCTIAYVTLAGLAFVANWVPWLALVQAPAPQLIAIALILAVVQLLTKQTAGASIVLLASGAYWILLAPFLLSAPDASDAGDAVAIKIAILENSNAAMVDFVRSVSPEIIAIADPSAPARDRLSDLAGDYPVRLSQGGVGSPLILARRYVRLYAIEPAPRETSGDLLLAGVYFRGRTFNLAVAHLGRPWPLGAWSQVTAMQTLTEGLAGTGDHLAIVGDFNRTPWMSDMQAFRDSLGLSVLRAPWTWPAGVISPLRLPLDLAMVGRGVEARAITPGPPIGSSHLPLLAEIALRP